MFYGWEPLRNISSPGMLKISHYLNAYMKESVDTELTDEAIRAIDEHRPDFVFLYMVDTDEKGGHDNGWMSAEYLNRISIAISNVRRVIEKYGEEYLARMYQDMDVFDDDGDIDDMISYLKDVRYDEKDHTSMTRRSVKKKYLQQKKEEWQRDEEDRFRRDEE